MDGRRLKLHGHRAPDWERSILPVPSAERHAALEALAEAAREIFVHFTPEHLDAVSGSTCGTIAFAALSRLAAEHAKPISGEADNEGQNQ